jgi:hypothetical protein
MFESLTPPTDNLYKFLAISGLAVVLVSATYPTYLYFDLDQQSLEIQRDTELLSFEVDQLNDISRAIDQTEARVDARMKDVDEQIEKLKRGEITQEAAFAANNQAKAEIATLREQATKLRDKARESQRNDIDRKLKLRQYDLLRERATTIAILGFVGIAVGLVTTVAGFSLWYSRMQRFQDEILARESLRANSDAATTVQAGQLGLESNSAKAIQPSVAAHSVKDDLGTAEAPKDEA